MEHDVPDLLLCARLLDERLHETLTEPFHIGRGRLYGATLLPGEEDPIRFCFVGEGRDMYAVLAGPTGELARQFDVAVAAVTGWSAPLDDLESGAVARPSLHPQRARIRLCCAVGDAGVAAVMRAEHEPATVVEMPDPGYGAMVEALRDMWAGTLVAVPPSRARRRAAHHAGRHRRSA